MNRAVKFYRDVLGLSLEFQSPGWSEFSTGERLWVCIPRRKKIPREASNSALMSPTLKSFTWK